MRILLVEDDTYLAEAILLLLKNAGYQAEICTTGRQALQALEISVFNLLILDLGLPDGFAGKVLQQLRERQHHLPVMILTALDDIETKLQLLNDGADDYVVKPFDMRELEVRIRVLLRRKIERASDIIQHKELRLNLATYQCELDAKPITLTRYEFKLLKAFLLHNDKVLSRQYLEELVFGWHGRTESNAVEVHIHHLRKKLYPELIKTVRGIGYVLY